MPAKGSDTGTKREFVGKPKKVSFARILAFSGGALTLANWPRKNHHTDLEFAKSIGLQTPCVSATQYMGHTISLLLQVFGEGWLQNGKLDVKFMRVVPPDETLQAKAIVKSERGAADAAELELEVWVENQAGQKVLGGTATGRVPGKE